VLKLWLVAQYEYKRNVLKKSFIWALLSVPLLMALIFGLGFLISRLQRDDRPVGYVDHAGLLANPVSSSSDAANAIPIIPFSTEAEADQALEAGEIQAYYVLAADYRRTSHAELVYSEEPSSAATTQFQDFLRVNLVADQPREIARRAAEGSKMIARTPDSHREYGDAPTMGQTLPLVVAFAFIMLIFIGSGSLMDAVIEEKESRTVEILATSISTNKLMAGKLLGVVAVNLTLFVAWAIVITLGVLIAAVALGIEWFQNMQLEAQGLLLVAVVLAPAYVLLSALLTTVGAIVAEAQEGQQMSAPFVLLFFIPTWLAVPLLNDPNGPLATGLSLFPFTAPLTMALRNMVTVVPLWQVAASVAILTACAVSAMWLAGRALRLGMLRYGKRLNWGELFRPQPIRGGRHE